MRYTVTGTATASSGSSAPVSAVMQFETFANTVRVTITNNIIGASKDVQAVSAIDFALTTGQTSGSIASQSGLVRTISAGSGSTTGTFVNGDTAGGRPANFSDASYAGEWIVASSGGLSNGLVNGLTITAMSGGSPQLTILGASDHTSSTCCYNDYGKPNNAVINHNPYLTTDGQDVVFDITVAGVTSSTSIGDVRFFFGTDRSAYLAGTPQSGVPEPLSALTLGVGMVILFGWRSAKQGRK